MNKQTFNTLTNWSRVALLTAAIFAVQSASGADPLPAIRKPAGLGWAGLVGVPGGIPRRTTIYQTIPAGASYTTIQNAVNSCPSNQVVQLSAGTYNLGGNRINIFNNGVTLRGAGMGQTILTGTDLPSVQIGNWQWWNGEVTTPTSGNHVAWTGGYAQGTTSITIANTTGYAVGQIIVLDQLNDADTDAAGNSSNGSYGGYNYTSVAYPNDGRDRHQYQVNRIKAISGNTITLSEPIYLPSWNPALSPQVWRFGNGSVAFSGVEDLEVSGAVQIHNGYGCWISNVKAHVGSLHANGCLRTYWSVRCQIEHCWYDGDVGVDNYGIETRASAGLLVQNNIAKGVNTALTPTGSHGSVWAYNVISGQVPFYPVMIQGLLQHGGHPYMNLYEGNFVPSIGLDNVWGSSIYNVAVRNRATGYNPASTAAYGARCAFSSSAHNRYSAAIGNVFGTTGVNTWYEDYYGQTTSCHNNGDVYYLGYGDVGCNTSPYADSLSRSTLIRAYNWTSATTTNNGIVTDGYTAGDIPASYYLSSKPAFFGNLPWPAVDPASPAYSGSYTNIPAGYRDVFGQDPPSGPVNNAPVVSVSVSTNKGNAPLVVNFSSTGSFDPEGVALTYSWNFGDNTATSTVANPSHTYATNGTFNARLTVYDGVNTTVSSNIPINVTIAGSNYPPSVAIAASTTAGVVPLVVAFTGTATDPENAALTYNWNFGDGTSSTTANPGHTYPVSGSYAATLTVSDGTNSVTSTALTIAVAAAGSGLQAAYGFEEGSGTTVGDISGKGNVGTAAGTTWIAGGRYGKAIGLGSGAMVTVNDSATLDLSSGMTLEVWVYPTNVNATWANLIMKPNGSPADFAPCYVLNGSTPSAVPSAYISPATANLLAPTALPLNTWSHIAVTYDGALMSFYLNGALVSSTAVSGAITASTDALTIGGNSYSGQNWMGLVDEVRIYNRALGVAEIQTDKDTPLVGTVVVPPVPTAPGAPQGLRVVLQ